MKTISETSISIYYILKACPFKRPISGARLNEIAHLLESEPEETIVLDKTDHGKIKTHLRCTRFKKTPEGYFVKAQKIGKKSIIFPNENIEEFILFFKTKEDFEDLLNEIDLEKVRKKLKKNVLFFLNKRNNQLQVGEGKLEFFKKFKIPKLGDKEFLIEESIQ